MDKVRSGETLTSLENFILSEGVRMMGGERASLFDFDLATWKKKGGFDSPYLVLFEDFLNNLKHTLLIYNVIELFGNRVPDTAIESIVKGARITDIRRDMRADRHKTANIGEKHLELWFIRIENKIINSPKVFDQYRKTAITDVKVYRDARYLVFKIGEVLLNSEGHLIEANIEKALNRILGFTVDHLYKDYKFKPYYLPKVGEGSAIESLKSSIMSIERSLTSEELNTIYKTITQFETKVKDFRKIRDTFSNIQEFTIIQPQEQEQLDTQDIELKNLAKTWRERLILDLQMLMVRYSDHVTGYTTIRGLSRLLFGEDTFITQNFWHDKTVVPDPSAKTRTIDRRPELYNLYRMKLLANTWTTEDFEKEGLIISHWNLEELKGEILNKIDEYIFSNPHQGHELVAEQPTRGRGALIKTFVKSFLTLESETITWIWLAYAIYEDKPSLTFEDIAMKKILSTWLTSYLSKGKRNIPAFALKGFTTELVSFYRDVLSGEHQNTILKISKDEKLKIFEKAFKQIFIYMKERKISWATKIFPQIEAKDDPYGDFWRHPLVKSYHNVFLFSGQLGFDPLTFTPLKGGDGGIFELRIPEKGRPTASYRRHHIDPELKKSHFLQDLIMTDIKKHATYEKIARDYGVQYVYKFRTAFGELVSMPGQIKESHIRNVFAKYGVMEVYEQYWKNNLKEHLGEFNNRKNDLHSLGIDGFFGTEWVKTKYEHFYHRFYLKFQKDALRNRKFLMLLVKDIPLGKTESEVRSYCDFIAADYFFSQFPRLVNYFNYHPHIFKYWFGD
ncbi:MAG: hypothetical protein ACXAEX_22440 [Promethearchaeota archaeon]|jgi:hypothetical protein